MIDLNHDSFDQCHSSTSVPDDILIVTKTPGQYMITYNCRKSADDLQNSLSVKNKENKYFFQMDKDDGVWQPCVTIYYANGKNGEYIVLFGSKYVTFDEIAAALDEKSKHMTKKKCAVDQDISPMALEIAGMLYNNLLGGNIRNGDGYKVDDDDDVGTIDCSVHPFFIGIK